MSQVLVNDIIINTMIKVVMYGFVALAYMLNFETENGNHDLH